MPAAHPELAFVLSAMVGHLFGYEAALAIDAQARPLREPCGGSVEDAVIAGATGAQVLTTAGADVVGRWAARSATACAAAC